MPVLVIARVLQGISAAVVWTIGLALVLDTVGPENLGKTIGSIFGFISVGELAAPVLGGVVYRKAGYWGVFGLGLALIAVDFTMRLLLIEKKTAAKYTDSKTPNGEPYTQHQDQEAENGDTNDQEEESLPLLQKEPLDSFKVPPNQPAAIRIYPLFYCLSDPRLLTALLLAFIQATLLSTFDATIPTIAQSYFGYNSLSAGLLFIALVLPYLLLGPIAGWCVDAYGTKPAAVLGFSYLVPVLILLRLVHPGPKPQQIILYCALLALCGVGLAVIGSPSIVEASNVVQAYEKANEGFFGPGGPYAQLYGVNSMVFSAGLTAGPLLAGALKDKVGYGNMNAVVAALCALTAALSAAFVGGRPRVLRRR